MEELNLKKVVTDLNNKKLAAIQNIEATLDTVCAETMLSLQIAQLLTTTENGSIGDTYGTHPAMIERLAEIAIPKFGVSPNKKISMFQSNPIYSLLQDILHADMISTRQSDDLPSISEDLKHSSKVIRGNAYPEQTAAKIRKIQGKFDSWFEAQVGISPNRVVDITSALVPRIEELYSNEMDHIHKNAESYQNQFIEYKNQATRGKKEQDFIDSFQSEEAAYIYGCIEYINLEICHKWPAELTELALLPAVTIKEADAFKSLFAVGKHNISQVEHIQRKPFYQLLDGRLLFGDISNAYDVIFDELEAIAKSDNKFFSNQYQKYKSKWLELRAYEHLCQIFPKSDVYQSLCYPDPDKINAEAEMDLAVKWGPFLLVVEAKSKQFRFEGRVGDVGRLRTDIVRNIQDGFEQSLRAKRYIASSNECHFKEKKTGKLLSFKSDDVKKIFPISITFNHLADVATRLHQLGDLNLFTDKDYPFSICESDFELLTKSNLTPDAFLYYIQRRIELFSDKREWMGDELDLFSAYLDTRLLSDNLTFGEEQDFTTMYFSNYSDQFDELMAFERGEYPTKPNIKLNLLPDTTQLFETLKDYDSDSARWIAFALLALSDSLLNKITQALLNIGLDSLNSGFRTMTFVENDTVVVLVGTKIHSFDDLRSHMANKALLEKYRYKANKCIVVGIKYCAGNPIKLFNTADYIEFKWVHDESIEQVLASIPKANIMKKIGRNEICFCGSGRKFKKCCINRIQ
ncbi:YecA family protein [Idiomarina abyssalis]|uniref:YecA family protein n=1 Tax=Idiomarina abyssalis TaxID=86102 RepID=UPI003A909D82